MEDIFMSNKRTLADLMNNDFFIDFDDTEAKVERKRLAESLIRKPLKESKLKEGFYKYDYDLSEDKISEEELYKALVTDGELVSLNAGNTGEAVSFKDGGVYCDTTYEITEYDGKFSIAEFYNSDDGDWKEGDYYFETDSFETLCAELQKIFPNALIECKMTEEVEEPDNAVVDCKVNKVIAHSEDEKPVDCLGKKKPLEKPLTEEASEIIYLSHALREEIAIRACDLDKIKQLDLEACKIYEDAYDAGLVDGAEEEQKLCRQYGVKTFNRAELFDMLTKDAKVDWDTIEWTYQKEIEEAKKMTADELKDKYGTDNVDLINAGREEQDRVELKEARSVAEIKAEIAKLQQELADAEAEEKKARIAKRPEVVYVWDIYLDPAEKGNWLSAEEDDITGMWEGTVYETADAAIRAGNLHLDELWDEGDLEYSRRDYYIDAYDIPLGNVSDETLSFSGLDYLIESLKESLSDVDSVRVMAWCTKHCVEFFEAVADNAPKTKQRKLNKEAYKAMQEKFGLATAEAEELMCKAYSLWKRLYR
jgi:hypothetical protein